MAEAIYLVGGARTPMGGLLGDLADVSAVELGTTAVHSTLEKTGIDPGRSTRSSWAVFSLRDSSNALPGRR